MLDGRSMNRQVLRHCFVYKKIHGKPRVQNMADLSSCRVTEGEPPFTYTGVD